MKITRRGFVGSIGLGTAAGILSNSNIFSRGAQAATEGSGSAPKVYDGGIMQLTQNESARGPGPKTIQALHDHISKRLGRGYAPDHVDDLRIALAQRHAVANEAIVLATGSGPLLQAGVRAFCTADKALVTVGPTYTTCEQTAREIGAGLKVIRVNDAMALDLDAMAAAAIGAGMVYLCNPNNPTGTVHSAVAIESFVRQVMRDSPATRIMIDEAYIDYVDPSVMQSAKLLAFEFANVFITRSFSKAHGMAGLRVGYAIGQEQTLKALNSAWNLGDINMLAAIAAITSLNDTQHIVEEREENTSIRQFTVAAFHDMGFEVAESYVNHIFVNLRRPASEFRAACLQHSIAVGRDFPPMENTHCRISLGSREEMLTAVEVFRKVLA
ncbi:MAG: histidinol-phosphate aminotransferase family protein [Gammaproteobacteria bacterium]|nr:histidinol-phosphate aminotransferase family protein [Gammaproteobacteria bacterium]